MSINQLNSIDWNTIANEYRKNYAQIDKQKTPISFNKLESTPTYEKNDKNKGLSTTTKLVLALALFAAGVYTNKKGYIDKVKKFFTEGKGKKIYNDTLNNIKKKFNSFKSAPIQEDLPGFAEAIKAANK